jgi:hypothetical protein
MDFHIIHSPFLSFLSLIPSVPLLQICSLSLSLFFLTVLEFEFRVYTLSLSVSPFSVMGFFNIGSQELFARAGFEPDPPDLCILSSLNHQCTVCCGIFKRDKFWFLEQQFLTGMCGRGITTSYTLFWAYFLYDTWLISETLPFAAPILSYRRHLYFRRFTLSPRSSPLQDEPQVCKLGLWAMLHVGNWHLIHLLSQPILSIVLS